MKERRLWSIEINLNGDPSDLCSWHINELNETILENITSAIKQNNKAPWVLVGLIESEKIPNEFADNLKRGILEEIKKNKSLVVKI